MSRPTSLAIALVLVAGCLGLLVIRGWLFSNELASPAPNPAADASGILTIYYHERQPLYYRAGGQMTGHVAERVAAAMERAGLACHWVAVPPARQLQLILSGHDYAAAVGRISTAERRVFARFSVPLFQDGTYVALVRHGEDRMHDGQRLDEVLADSRLLMLVSDAFSYGPELDALIVRHNPRRVNTTSSTGAKLNLLTEGRADYFLLALDEAEWLLAHSSAGLHRMVQFEHAPRGAVRHLMFSRRVPESAVQRFDKAWTGLDGEGGTP